MIGLSLRWTIRVGMLWLISLSGLAQPVRFDHELASPTNSWRLDQERTLRHEANGRVVQQQLTRLGKRLTKLSVVAPPIYSTVQGELQRYLRQLQSQRPDYADSAFFVSLTLRLVQIEKQVNAALAEYRSDGITPSFSGLVSDSGQVVGRQVQLFTCALLFHRPDYRSSVRYVVLPNDYVTLQKTGNCYSLVQCVTKKGYVYNGMIVCLLP